jgi:cyclophilin family peptidyl-prolyl cis-trans isomerase
MVQGGDPTGTGKGGECIWGGTMEDEFHPQLRVSQMFACTHSRLMSKLILYGRWIPA